MFRQMAPTIVTYYSYGMHNYLPLHICPCITCIEVHRWSSAFLQGGPNLW